MLRDSVDFMKGLEAGCATTDDHVPAVDIAPYRARLVEAADEVGHVENGRKQSTVRVLSRATHGVRADQVCYDRRSCDHQPTQQSGADHPELEATAQAW